MANHIGQQLGNYRLVSLIGTGGFAEVYLGEHVHLGTQAAIKLLQTHLATAGEIEKFRTEAQTIVTLQHSNIVRVLDFGIEAGIPYLVMDYAPNGSLRQRLPAETPLPAATILPLLLHVSSALHYAHERKLIHRDIKPENLLLGLNHEVLLSDFGIAVVAHNTSQQRTQGVAGTAAYMAPEQLQGKPRPASDLYALGVVVYEWLCGERPFQGGPIEVATQHLLTPPPPLREKVPGIPEAIEQVVLTALAKDPRERFGSVRAFAAAFAAACQTDTSFHAAPTQRATPTVPLPPPTPPTPALADQPALIRPPSGAPIVTPASMPPPLTEPTAPAPVQAHSMPVIILPSEPPGAPEIPIMPAEPAPPRRPLSRRAILIAGGSAAGLAVLGGGGFWLAHSYGARMPPTSTAPTPTPSTSAPLTPTTQIPLGTLFYTYHGHTDTIYAVAWSPGGTRLASGSGDRMVQVWDASNGAHPFTYHGHERAVYAVTWSPTGARIASGSGDHTVRVWDAVDGGHPYIYQDHLDAVTAVAWSPDGTKIASSSLDDTARVWNADGSGHLYTYPGHFASVQAVAWSPGSKRIASGSADKTVQVWDATDGGHPLTYAGHTGTVNAVAWSPDGKHIASGSNDGTVQVWNAVDGSPVFTYRGHSSWVASVAWSPDGGRIASGSGDNTVQVWDASDGGHPFIYKGHTNRVFTVVWLPGGKRVASGSADQTVQVWQGE